MNSSEFSPAIIAHALALVDRGTIPNTAFALSRALGIGYCEAARLQEELWKEIERRQQDGATTGI